MGLFRRRRRTPQPGWALLADAVPWHEAVLIRGLLESAGIEPRMDPVDGLALTRTLAPPRQVHVFVPEDRYDEARSLMPDTLPDSVPDMTKPGEGLPRVDIIPNLPDGYVRLGILAAGEAYVVHGFLTSNGIEAVLLLPAWAGAIVEFRNAPPQIAVAVPEDRLEETRELLRSENLIPGDPEG